MGHYLSDFKHRFPNSKVVESTLRADKREKDIETSLFAILRLDIEAVLVLPAIDKLQYMITTLKRSHNRDLAKPEGPILIALEGKR